MLVIIMAAWQMGYLTTLLSSSLFMLLSFQIGIQSKRGRQVASIPTVPSLLRDRLKVARPLHLSMERLRRGLHTLGLVSPRRVYRFLRRATRFLAVSYRLCYTLHLLRNRALVTLSTYLLPSAVTHLLRRSRRSPPRPLLGIRPLPFPFRLLVCFSVRRWRCR